MSQAEKEVRKYNRGNDEIELDAWLGSVSSGYDEFEKGLIGRAYRDSKGKRIEITLKDLEGLRNAYNAMFQRLNSGDNSITYNYENAKKGFNDSTGKIKGDSVYNGLIAKYFGDKLREMAVYKKPETTPIIAPVDYSESALGNIFLKRAFGSGTVKSFIDKDILDKATKTRVNTERSKYTREILQNMLNDLLSSKNEFSRWTDEQKNQASTNLTNLFTIFDNDNAITDNEYFDLERLLGLSNARLLYATGESTAPLQETVVDSNGNVVRRGKTYADKIRAIQGKWGLPYVGELASPITIGKYNMSRLGQDAANKISTALNNASTADLTSIILDILGREGRNALNTRFISNIFNGDNPFVGASEEDVRNFLLTNALNLLSGKPADHNGGLHNFGESNLGAYYIGGTQTDRGTGFVFDKNNRTISEMGIYNIPYWQTYINNWWNSLENSDDESDLNPTLTSIFKRKEGGIIRKFNKGGYLTYDTPYVDADDIYNISLLDKYDESTGKGLFQGFVGSRHDAGKAAGLTDFLNKFTDNVATSRFTTGDAIAALESYKAKKASNNVALFVEDAKSYLNASKIDGATLQSLIDQYNEDVKKTREWQRNKQNLRYGTLGQQDNNLTHSWLYENYGKTDRGLRDILGSATYSRLALAFKDLDEYRDARSFKLDGYDDNIWFDNAGYLHIGEYGGNPTSPGTKVEKLSEVKPEVKPKETPKQEVKKDPGSDVPEVDTDPRKDKFGNNRFASTIPDFIPTAFDILGTGLSHWYNRKIERAAQPHLSLRDPLNLHKAVLGNEPLKLAYHRKEAEVKSAAYRNADADADRNAARMFEAQRIGSEIGLRGDLIDDEAIRKSKEELFSLTKELAYFNKLNVYDINKDRIAKFLDTKGLLRASRLKSNWLSMDKTIRAMGTRLATRAEEDRQYNIAANQHLREKYNKSIYNEELSQIASLRNAWISANPGKSITSASWYSQVAQREAELMDRLDNDNILSSGKVRGYNYLDLYKDNPYVKKDWDKIIV